MRASARSIGLAARLGGTLSARRLRRRAPLTFRNRALVGGLRAAVRVSRQLRTQDLVPSRGPPMVTRRTRNVQCRTLVMPRGLAGGELRDMELCIFGGFGPALVLAHVESILVSRASVCEVAPHSFGLVVVAAFLGAAPRLILSAVWFRLISTTVLRSRFGLIAQDVASSLRLRLLMPRGFRVGGCAAAAGAAIQ